MRLGLILTARCNAACDHCSRNYGPNRPEELQPDQVFRLMDEAAAIEETEPLAFDLTGGEPFVDFERLVAVVRYAAQLRAEVSCVTNAFWARTDEIAREKLSTLQNSGLTSLSVSVSRFHQQYVPLHRAKRALDIAMQLGIPTELKAAVLNGDLAPGGLASQWNDELRAEWVNLFPVLPHSREGKGLPEDEYYREPGLPQHKCPGEEVSVDFNGIARSCCSPGAEDQFLIIGDTNLTPLGQIQQTLRNCGKQRILRETGPIGFARGAIAAGLQQHLRPAYAGPCDLCLHIRSDPLLRQVAENMAAAMDHQRGGGEPVAKGPANPGTMTVMPAK